MLSLSEGCVLAWPGAGDADGHLGWGARLDVFTAAPHDDVLKLLIQFAVLLAVARGLGEAASRADQPRVLGEILAGIILGPSVLSGMFGTFERWMVPESDTQGYLLEAVALIGAMLLMLITGMEMDLGLVRRHAATALGVSFGGIAFTFSTGFILGQLLPDSLLAQPDRRLVFALFMATAMSISAIPVIAKVLMDLNLMRRDIGQTIVAAGMSDDTIGWIILSIVIGMASGQATTWSSVAADIGGVAAFMVVSFTLGRWVAVRAVDFVQDRLRTEDRMLTLTVVLALGWAAVAQALHLEAVLGAFVCGIVLGQIPHLPAGVHQRLESMALAVFTPVFFGVAGLKVDIGRIVTDSTLALVAIVVIAVATFGKVAGTYAGARLIGRADHWTALSFGAGLNARGAMEIIIATIGLSVGVLTQDMFSIIVLMAMVTSLMAPTALRFTLARVTPKDEELRRLKREEIAAASIVSGFRNVLYPVRPGNGGAAPDRDLAVQVIEGLGAAGSLRVTLLAVTPPGDRARANATLERLERSMSKARVTRKVVESENVANAILDEAAREVDVIVLGAPRVEEHSEVLFNPMVDYVVRLAACASLIVRGSGTGAWPPRRILVPTNGSPASVRAGQVAFALANDETEVVALHVMTTPPDDELSSLNLRTQRQERLRAREVVRAMADQGTSMGVATRGRILRGLEPAAAILRVADEQPCDLIVVGTDLRPGSDRLYLGPAVERIIRQAECPVLVVNA